MAFPTYSMISVILGSTILVLTWIASNKMKKCTSTGVHTNLQILMMVGTANVVLGFTGLLDHAIVKASQIVNMVYIFAVGTITMVSSIFLLTSANATANNTGDPTEDKLEGCESVDTEAMILAIIGGVIVLGFVSKVHEYWKAEQEVSSSELKQKQATARAATKTADLAQQAVNQKIEQQAHNLALQQAKNQDIMNKEKQLIKQLEAKRGVISTSVLSKHEKEIQLQKLESEKLNAKADYDDAQKVSLAAEKDLEALTKLAEIESKEHEKQLQEAVKNLDEQKIKTAATRTWIERETRTTDGDEHGDRRRRSTEERRRQNRNNRNRGHRHEGKDFRMTKTKKVSSSKGKKKVSSRKGKKKKGKNC
jgi:hypothetical protein